MLEGALPFLGHALQLRPMPRRLCGGDGMSVHVERAHHRPRVVGWAVRRGHWFAMCQCGYGRASDTWHEALVFALAHAEVLR